MSWSEDRSAHLPSSEQHVKEESQWATKTRAMLGWNPTSWKSNRCQPRRERERERISDGKDADLIKQVSLHSKHSSVTVSPHTQTMKNIPDVMKGLSTPPWTFSRLSPDYFISRPKMLNLAFAIQPSFLPQIIQLQPWKKLSLWFG